MSNNMIDDVKLYTVLLIILSIVLLIFKRYWTFYQKLRKLPTHPSNFILGHLELFAGKLFGPQTLKPYEYTKNAYEVFSKAFENHPFGIIWLGWYPYVFVTHAEAAETLMSDNRLLEKGAEYKYMHPWIGTGLLTSTGKKWKSRRRLLTPAFHFKILEEFYPIISEQSSILVKKFKENVGNPVDVFQYIPLASLDIICETAMGVTVDAQKSPESDYVNAVVVASDVVWARVINPKYWLDFIFYRTEYGKIYKKAVQILRKFTLDVITRRKVEIMKTRDAEEMEKFTKDARFTDNGEFTRRKKLSFIDILLDSHLSGMRSDGSSDFELDDIREEVDTFMFEGHDTTASAISFGIHMLGHHPEIQESIYEELMQTIGEDSECEITSEHLKGMKYLERVIKEILRLAPSVPSINRVISEDVNVCGYDIPKGLTYFIYIHGINRDPKIFPEPNVFNPDNFLPENVNGRHAYAYLPFSAGSRNCIGQKFALMEMKTIIVNIMRHLRFKSVDPVEDIPKSLEIITRPKGPLNVIFSKRR